MRIKGYSIYDQMQFCDIPIASPYFLGGILPLCRGYSQCIVSPTDRVRWFHAFHFVPMLFGKTSSTYSMSKIEKTGFTSFWYGNQSKRKKTMNSNNIYLFTQPFHLGQDLTEGQIFLGIYFTRREYSEIFYWSEKISEVFVSLFNGISTFVGYLMSKPSL